MAKGYPDYYGIPMFPSYYATVFDYELVSVNTDAITTIITATGKGLLYYAQLVCTDHTMDNAHVLRLYIDGEVGPEIAFNTEWMKYAGPRPTGLWRIVQWDIVNSLADFELSGPIPFVQSTSIRFTRATGIAVPVTGRLMYSLIAD